MSSLSSSARARRPSLVRHPDFLKLWTAETISQFGTQVSLLAIPLIAALTLKVSAFEFGLIGTFEFLPFILLSLPAGVWVDRLRRRPILIIGDVGRAVSLLSIPIAFYFNALTIYQLYLVGFINGCLTVFFDVAYQSYLPALVDREDLVEGNSKLEVSRSGAQMVGPGLSGVLIGALSAPFAILLDALSFLGSALFVLFIRKHEPLPKRAATADGKKGPGMRTEIAEGLHYVLGHRYLRNIAACTGSSNLFTNLAFAILVLYLVRTFEFSPELLGITFSIGSVGFLLGALMANRIAERIGVGPTILGAAVIFSFSLLPVALATRELAVPLAAASGFLGGFGSAIYNINQVSLRQAITPERMQGRMNATMRFIVWGTIPIGTILGGFLGDAIGLHATIWVGTIGALFAFLPILFSQVRSIGEMPTLDEGSAEGVEGAVGEALDETPRPVTGSPRASLDEPEAPEAN